MHTTIVSDLGECKRRADLTCRSSQTKREGPKKQAGEGALSLAWRINDVLVTAGCYEAYV